MEPSEVTEIIRLINTNRQFDWDAVLNVCKTHRGKDKDLDFAFDVYEYESMKHLGISGIQDIFDKIVSKEPETPMQTFFLGKLYDIDDDPKCLALFDKASQAGDPFALNMMGWCCQFGHLGTTQDIQLAKDYFEKAAALGNHLAFYNLGRIYDQGQSRNIEKAIHNYRISADYEYPYGCEEVGKLYLETEKYDLCREYFEKSIKLKNAVPDMLMELGNIYFYGKECDQDYTKAREYYKDALSLDFSGNSQFVTELNEILRYMDDNQL